MTLLGFFHKLILLYGLNTYNVHGSWENKTGYNAPMYDNPSHVFNCSDWWTNNGIPRQKINIGIPTFGQLFTLANSNNHGLGATTIGGGTLNYREICNNN